ncbi:RidA family protein [Pseudomonas taiwanensis]|jgi:2-iminobutanoate/2-iminopropanoate deaminase|uniref:RidA family protein n=1 Tax=Pseudomonas taiwanensis TaxID=470150 RepID=UPI0009DC132C|nr:RidA family protein [Pseudomonas taiwanensis]
MSNLIQRYPSQAPLPLSRAVRAGGFLFLSGQIPVSPSGDVVRGDIRVQTRAVCQRIGESLAACGASFDQVVKATVWLSDLSHFDGLNEVYREFFGSDLPARSTVTSELVLGVDVEIEVQAFVGQS